MTENVVTITLLYGEEKTVPEMVATAAFALDQRDKGLDPRAAIPAGYQFRLERIQDVQQIYESGMLETLFPGLCKGVAAPAKKQAGEATRATAVWLGGVSQHRPTAETYFSRAHGKEMPLTREPERDLSRSFLDWLYKGQDSEQLTDEEKERIVHASTGDNLAAGTKVAFSDRGNHKYGIVKAVSKDGTHTVEEVKLTDDEENANHYERTAVLYYLGRTAIDEVFTESFPSTAFLASAFIKEWLDTKGKRKTLKDET